MKQRVEENLFREIWFSKAPGNKFKKIFRFGHCHIEALIVKSSSNPRLVNQSIIISHHELLTDEIELRISYT